MSVPHHPLVWFLRSLVVNFASRVPGYESAHFRLQRILGRHRIEPSEMLGRALEQFRLLRHEGLEVQGKNVLEIGTGWFPFTATLASLLGAASVTTVDIHPWLRLENLRRTVAALEPSLGRIAAATGKPLEGLAARYAAMQRETSRAGTLQEALHALNIDYRCPLSLTTTEWRGKPMHIALSSNVLEHIPPAQLRALHSTIASCLTSDGMCIHRFNPGDHFAALTGSSIHFLKYSDRTWRFLDGRGVSYHNRLRTPEYAELLQGTGLTLTFWAETIDDKAYEQIEAQRVALRECYAGMDPASICAYYAWHVLRPAHAAGTPVRAPLRVRWIDEVLDAQPPAAAVVESRTCDADSPEPPDYRIAAETPRVR